MAMKDLTSVTKINYISYVNKYTSTVTLNLNWYNFNCYGILKLLVTRTSKNNNAILLNIMTIQNPQNTDVEVKNIKL